MLKFHTMENSEAGGLVRRSTHPGDAIRARRKKSAMTLKELSQRTGLAVSTLSKLEKGQMSLSYDKLLLLSKGLGVDMALLLQPNAGPAASSVGGGGRRVVQRAGEGQVIETHSYHQVYLATELLNKQFTPLIGEAKIRTIEEFLREFGDWIRHPGEEFMLVLEGEIDFHTELYAPLHLKSGDSVYFDSDMGHAYLKGAEGSCRIVAICSSRGEAQMIETFVNASERRVADRSNGVDGDVPKSSTPRVRRAKP
jgi:transcriptional regulator with XRE-family HTH domain